MLHIYNILMAVTALIGWPLIVLAAVFSSKRRKSILQRLGLKDLPTIGQSAEIRPIWVHALSVGEVLSALPLVSGLKKQFKKRPIIFSVSTLSGFGIAATQVAPLVDELCFFPYDIIPSIRRVADRIDPAMVVLVETDIWPNFLAIMQKRNVPVALVNARLSNKSYKGYRRLSLFSRTVFGMLTAVGAQIAVDAEKFQALGVASSKLRVTGSLKFDQQLSEDLPENIADLNSALERSGQLRIFLAGSIHKGEEVFLGQAFLRLKHKIPKLGMLVVPRDPADGRFVWRHFDEIGLNTVLATELNNLDLPANWEVVVVAAMGVLRDMYSLCEVAFVGGSMVASGGHNPLEPAALKKPILFGTDMGDFMAAAEPLLKAGGAYQVVDEEDLYQKAVLLFTDDKRRENTGAKAYTVFCANQGAVSRTINQLSDLMDADNMVENDV